MSKSQLKDMVVNDPKTGPLGLKVGRAHAGTDPIRTVVDVHPSFGNAERLGYLRRLFLVEAGLMPDSKDKDGGDRWLLQLIHWTTNGMRIVSESLKVEDIHISFQSKWMSEVLVHEENGVSYEGGLLSDVTYRFFNHGYLMTTSMYCEKIERFVPVLLTWMNGLSKDHYKSHFKTLLQQIKDTAKSDEQKNNLTEQIVDFSQAQKVGFMSAYMEVFNVDRDVALSKLHGCSQYFSQAVTCLKKNRSIVRFDLKDDWEAKCKALLKPDTPGNTLEMKFAKLFLEFLNAKKWLDWWCTADTQAMLFPGRKRMPLDDPPLSDDESDGEKLLTVKEIKKKLHSTTNGQESMHRVYYLLS
ncbi:uncharacterized protein MELLADRAFT_88787 [Melampsora larici-populina 98AG31]|uniref:Uncharacterized protein n=1 Tax=Melampsora larici-populina (strain 98AG31 / pathotype 3-4-7) TaxID=747676 RepID=F4RT00_MELLP|nr:uncharacterized protein MELLADRAFT_88787 [Melampsora larici-populina 98AG31]EGG04514.1 hypothetical protein MELLADRAFT_88787 [Melampsora larici-populina 98AG31]